MCRSTLFLVAVLLAFLANETAPKLVFKRFLCDSAGADKVRSLKVVRMLIKNHTVYLVGNSGEVFKFQVPIVFPNYGQLFHLSGPFYEAKLEKPLPERPLIGYYVNGSQTLEINHSDPTFLELAELDVDDSFAVGDYKKVEILPELQKYLSKSKFNLFYESKKSKSLIFMTADSYRPRLTVINSQDLKSLIFNNLTNHMELTILISFFVYDEAEETNNNTLMWIGHQNNFYINGNSSIQNFSEFSWLAELNLTRQEFFRCPSKEGFNLKTGLKGILYSDNRFFLFINHYYFGPEEDLVETKFDLSSEHLMNSVQLLPTRDVDYGFENNAAKYVKTTKNGALLVFAPGEMYEPSVKNGKLTLQPVDELKHSVFALPNCLGQTLSITKIFFCFNETAYHPMLGVAENEQKFTHEIAGLFANMDIYPKDEQLLYTFSYKQEQFVLMTQTALYLVKYKAIRVDLNSYKMLIDDQKLVTKLENGLFQKLTPGMTTSSAPGSVSGSVPGNDTPPDKSRSPGETSSPHPTTELYGKKPLNLISLALFALFAATILLTLLFYVCKYVRKQDRRDSDLLKEFMLSQGAGGASSYTSSPAFRSGSFPNYRNHRSRPGFNSGTKSGIKSVIRPGMRNSRMPRKK